MKVHVYYTYILECNDGTLYVGVTNDLERRSAEHRDGADPGSYTSMRQPVRLAYFEIFQWIEDAIKREKQLKGWSSPKKKALMQSDEEVLRRLSACRNASHYQSGPAERRCLSKSPVTSKTEGHEGVSPSGAED